MSFIEKASNFLGFKKPEQPPKKIPTIDERTNAQAVAEEAVSAENNPALAKNYAKTREKIIEDSNKISGLKIEK